MLAPIGPCVRLRVEMLGPGDVTVKGTPLLGAFRTVTTIFPVRAPLGTGTPMLVGLQLVGVPAIPLKVTVLLPLLLPKFVPPIVTGVAMVPVVGVTVPMLGAGTTVKFTPLLATPPTVTTTFPVVAPAGTGIMIVVAFQVPAPPADVPLNVTVLVPWVVPKFVPVIVIGTPIAPEVWLKVVMLGPNPPVPPRLRKATICMIHSWVVLRLTVAL